MFGFETGFLAAIWESEESSEPPTFVAPRLLLAFPLRWTALAVALAAVAQEPLVQVLAAVSGSAGAAIVHWLGAA